MSDSYRLIIDVDAGDERGFALLLRLQELGIPWAIERLPEKPGELRAPRRAARDPLVPSEAAEGTGCALDVLLAEYRLNPDG